jgi:hypothetical protein
MTSVWTAPVEPRWHTQAVTPPGFQWTREPLEQWRVKLRIMRPLTDTTEGLSIVWEPGDVWEPVQRWMIYGVIPRRAIPADVLKQLQGEHPRSRGHGCFPGFCLCARPQHRWVGGPAPLITRTQWLLFRETGGWARPLWVVQGDKGGHKRRFTEWESRLSKLVGGPAQPPFPGALAYAEPDERTWANLQLYADPELLRQYRGIVGFGLRRPGDLDPTDAKAAQFAAVEVLKSLGLGVAEHADEMAWWLKKMDPSDLPDMPDRDDTDDLEAAMAAVTDEMAEEIRSSA